MLDIYASSGVISTYQRSLCNFQIKIESKKLAKYNAALKKASQVNFDEDMEFLHGFVQKAKLNGAKDYRKIRSKENVEN